MEALSSPLVRPLDGPPERQLQVDLVVRPEDRVVRLVHPVRVHQRLRQLAVQEQVEGAPRGRVAQVQRQCLLVGRARPLADLRTVQEGSAVEMLANPKTNYRDKKIIRDDDTPVYILLTYILKEPMQLEVISESMLVLMSGKNRIEQLVFTTITISLLSSFPSHCLS